MNIIVRCCGERTEKKCIQLAELQGTVHIIRAYPFGESLRQSYKLGMTFKQKWVPMIDADVILLAGSIIKGIKFLNDNDRNRNIFCLDGKTKDKIFLNTRRAGIHIYRRSLLEQALPYIKNTKIKPESHVRRTMVKLGYPTVTGKIVFGYHDYEQYYCDLWRKSFAQTQKLAGKIRKTNIRNKWKKRAETDKDFKVILAAHDQGRLYQDRIIIDKRKNYGAEEGLKRLGIQEKNSL
jgi:hypothetical protein